jgi:hypothetical protein
MPAFDSGGTRFAMTSLKTNRYVNKGAEKWRERFERTEEAGWGMGHLTGRAE